MIKFGIKLWTINKDWFREAVDLFNKKEIDFVELYVVPNSFGFKDLEILKKIPITIHAPHDSHNFNIFALDRKKIELFKEQVVAMADFFGSKHIVLHAGSGNDKNVFEKNITDLRDKRIIIENMPMIACNNSICFGYTQEQLQFIKNQCKLDICLDVSHAVKSAISQKIDYKNYFKFLIEKLRPDYLHISDGSLDSEKDEHLNLGEGDFDLRWIKNTIMDLAEKQDVNLVFEVPKNQRNLQNDLKNIGFFKDLKN